jgi:hypothetical protein
VQQWLASDFVARSIQSAIPGPLSFPAGADKPLTFISNSRKDEQHWRDDSLLQAQTAVRFEDKPEKNVARIKGHVHLSLPRRVDTVSIDAVEVGTRVSTAGETVTLNRLDDKGFSLDFGDRRPAVVAVNAYNASGDAIWVPHPELTEEGKRWVGVFPTHGAAARIEVMLAGEVEEAQFPFEFSVGQ